MTLVKTLHFKLDRSSSCANLLQYRQVVGGGLVAGLLYSLICPFSMFISLDMAMRLLDNNGNGKKFPLATNKQKHIDWSQYSHCHIDWSK